MDKLTKKLVDAITESGFEVRSYSGRGMYGKNCVGALVGSDQTLFGFGVAMALAFNDDAEELIGMRVERDSMGYDQVFYFPDVEWEEDEDLDDGGFDGDPAECDDDPAGFGGEA